jgi:trehalose 6-phosphate phosphatase
MPEYLFDHIQKIFTRLHEVDKILLLLDYDGTLVSFKENPRDVITSDEIKSLLTYFVQNKQFIVVIVTGRTLHEIKQLIDIDGLSYAAVHGLQIELAHKTTYHLHSNENSRSILDKIKDRSVSTFQKEKGIFIEDKTYTLAFHYRALDKKKIQPAINTFLEIVNKIDAENCYEIIHGAKVIEIRPKGGNKGNAVEYILTSYKDVKKKLPIYIGDDTTDEDAFRTLQHQGITIFVTNNSNLSTKTAHYWVKNPADVLKFLQYLKSKSVEIKDTVLFK